MSEPSDLPIMMGWDRELSAEEIERLATVAEKEIRSDLERLFPPSMEEES